MAVETARALPNRRNVPKVYTKMTERHQMRTLTKNQMALFFLERSGILQMQVLQQIASWNLQ
jgi:hypothetical protein